MFILALERTSCMASKRNESPLPDAQQKSGQIKLFKKGLIHSSWRDRYLKLNRNYLLVFETQHTYQPLESIVRNEIKSVRKLAEVTNGFEIKVKEFEYYTFQTSSEDEREEWVAAIENRVPVSSSRLTSQAQVAHAARQADRSDFPARFQTEPAVLYPGLPEGQSSKEHMEREIQQLSTDNNNNNNPPPYNMMF